MLSYIALSQLISVLCNSQGITHLKQRDFLIRHFPDDNFLIPFPSYVQIQTGCAGDYLNISFYRSICTRKIAGSDRMRLTTRGHKNQVLISEVILQPKYWLDIQLVDMRSIFMQQCNIYLLFSHYVHVTLAAAIDQVVFCILQELFGHLHGTNWSCMVAFMAHWIDVFMVFCWWLTIDFFISQVNINIKQTSSVDRGDPLGPLTVRTNAQTNSHFRD